MATVTRGAMVENHDGSLGGREWIYGNVNIGLG